MPPSAFQLQFQCIMGPFQLTLLTLIPTWVSNYIHYKVYDDITYSFPNFTGAAVNIWEWLINFTHTLHGMCLLIHTGI